MFSLLHFRADFEIAWLIRKVQSSRILEFVLRFGHSGFLESILKSSDFVTSYQFKHVQML